VLAFDLLGFGLSAKPRGHAYSIFEQADLAEHLLASQGIASYHVLAHDYGDTVAQELLARSREPGRRPALRSVAFPNGGRGVMHRLIRYIDERRADRPQLFAPQSPRHMNRHRA
jgi:pimeloyl-ACP methyl ester carboxylesterase